MKQWLSANDETVSQDSVLWALQDVSFMLNRGESLALIGPNGSGKTTILKLLSEITKPTYGIIETNGRLSALIELGAGFHPDLTGRENIYLNGIILGLDRDYINGRFEEIVEFSELERFLDTPVKRYSSGMIVRLGFAVAACIEPEILLVDEVLAVGDASFRQKCMTRISELIDSGTTLVFVSHNLYLVQAVCRSALYINQGQIIASGNTPDIISIYEQDLHKLRAKEYGQGDLLFDPDVTRTDVEITKVELCNGAGENNRTFHSDEPAQVCLYYDARSSLGKVQVSLFIRRSDGLTCCALRTKLDGFELKVDRGQGVISVNLETLQLISGTYYVEAAFLNESDSMALSSSPGRSDWFSVTGSGLSYGPNSGVFEPRTTWEHQVVSAQEVQEYGNTD